MNKNKVTIRLMGHDYTLLSDQSPASVERKAKYVDRKMRELSLATRAGEQMVSMLTCMTLADELFVAQEEVLRLRRELDAAHHKQKEE